VVSAYGRRRFEWPDQSGFSIDAFLCVKAVTQRRAAGMARRDLLCYRE